MERVWDDFLSEQDRELLRRLPNKRIGWGVRPAILMIDNFRGVFGDRPQPILEAIEEWPTSMGLAAWDALEPMTRLLAAGRATGMPVIHVTGIPPEDGVAPWRKLYRSGEGERLGRTQRDQESRRYEIMDEVAPLAGETIIRKSAPSAFFGTPLAAHLNGIGADTLIVAGESASGCVRATVIDGASYRYRVVVPEECVYARHQASRAISLFDMDRVYADVLPLQDVLRWIGNHEVQGAS